MGENDTADFLVVGGGMAGASAAYELSARGRVLLLERESQPGTHTTGRSAAVFTETYGNAVIRALTTASRGFLTAPPPGFAERPLLGPRGVLAVGREDQAPALAAEAERGGRLGADVRLLTADEALALLPVLRRDTLAGAVWEPDAMDIDVHGLLSGYLRGLRARGGRVVTGAEVLALARTGGAWRATTPAGTFRAPMVVDAAGAWADRLAVLAGARPLGLQPRRRTIVTFAPTEPEAVDPAWPFGVDIGESFYFKPETGRILASPADETPAEPADAQPEELDVALAIDRVERATTLKARRVINKWAGLRTFAADRTPVVGTDPDVEGFFWLAGQGGYGIQTAPALARLAAALAFGETAPADVTDFGVTAEALAPGRLHDSAGTAGR